MFRRRIRRYSWYEGDFDDGIVRYRLEVHPAGDGLLHMDHVSRAVSRAETAILLARYHDLHDFGRPRLLAVGRKLLRSRNARSAPTE